MYSNYNQPATQPALQNYQVNFGNGSINVGISKDCSPAALQYLPVTIVKVLTILQNKAASSTLCKFVLDTLVSKQYQDQVFFDYVNAVTITVTRLARPGMQDEHHLTNYIAEALGLSFPAYYWASYGKPNVVEPAKLQDTETAFNVYHATIKVLFSLPQGSLHVPGLTPTFPNSTQPAPLADPFNFSIQCFQHVYQGLPSPVQVTQISQGVPVGTGMLTMPNQAVQPAMVEIRDQFGNVVGYRQVETAQPTNVLQAATMDYHGTSAVNQNNFSGVASNTTTSSILANSPRAKIVEAKSRMQQKQEGTYTGHNPVTEPATAAVLDSGFKQANRQFTPAELQQQTSEYTSIFDTSAYTAGLETNVVLDTEPVPYKERDPNKDWFEVTDPKITDWFPNYSQWHPKAFNPRTHKRVLLRNANGDYKEEFKEVEYNQHAIITSNLSAEYNKARLEIAQEKGIDKTQVRLDDATERVIVRTPTPDTRDYDDIYEHNEVEFGLSMTKLMWYNLVIRNKTRNEIFFKRTTERTKMPDVILSTCYNALAALGETKKHKSLQDLLCKATSWIELRNALTLEATSETRYFRNKVNYYLTDEVNLALKGCAGVTDMYIDDFYEDLPDLVEELKANYPRKVYEAFLDSFNPVGFINKFSAEEEDRFQEIAGKILVPYEDMEDVEQTFSCIGTKATVISLDESSFEMEFFLRKGEVKQVTEWVSSRLYKLLGKTLATNRDSYEHYLLTGDGKTYRIMPSKIEPNVINLVAID